MKAFQKEVDETLAPMAAVCYYGTQSAHENLSYHETSVLHEGHLVKFSDAAQVMTDPCLSHYHCLNGLEWVQVAALDGSTNCVFQLCVIVTVGLN